MSALDPTLQPLWQRLHRRYGASGRRVASVRVTGLDERQRTALAELLRMPALPPPDVTVPTPRLAAALQVDEDGLRALVEAALGTAGNRAAVRTAAAAARDRAADRLAQAAGPGLAGWARRQAVGSGDDLDRRVETALAVLAVLAADRTRPVPLPVVAAGSFGDPHALDLDRPAGRMLAGALAARDGRDRLDARDRRRLLRQVGIVADELSSTVAVYRLPVAPDHPLAGIVASHEPTPVTLGQLTRHPLTLRAPAPVRAVENPAVLATAALSGLAHPMVCTSGMPSVAAVELVTQLVEAGCPVGAHADFDAAGLGVVTQLLTGGARPWRMGTGCYRQAAALSTVELDPSPDDVGWAPGLAATMCEIGRVGFEEHLLDVLLDGPGPSLP